MKKGDSFSMILTWSNDIKLKPLIYLDPLPPCWLFCLFSDLLSLFWLVDLAMLWSYCASRPSGYLDIVWSQSFVNQISSDLADLADKTLHGKRKWQPVGTQGSTMNAQWSDTDHSCSVQEWKYITCAFCNFQFIVTDLIWTLLTSACLIICWIKSLQGITSLTKKTMTGKGNSLVEFYIKGQYYGIVIISHSIFCTIF